MSDRHEDHTARPTDDKGRPLVESMDNTEMLRELTTNMRAVADAIDGLSDSPMVKAMMSGSNPLMAMMGRS